MRSEAVPREARALELLDVVREAAGDGAITDRDLRRLPALAGWDPVERFQALTDCIRANRLRMVCAGRAWISVIEPDAVFADLRAVSARRDDEMWQLFEQLPEGTVRRAWEQVAREADERNAR